MSSSISNIVDELINVIEGSDLYQEYLRQQEVAKGDPELKDKIDEIRRLNYLLQTERNSDAALEEQDKLENRYEELSEDKRVYDFIQAESDFIKMYQEVYKKVLNKIQFI